MNGRLPPCCPLATLPGARVNHRQHVAQFCRGGNLTPGMLCRPCVFLGMPNAFTHAATTWQNYRSPPGGRSRRFRDVLVVRSSHIFIDHDICYGEPSRRRDRSEGLSLGLRWGGRPERVRCGLQEYRSRGGAVQMRWWGSLCGSTFLRCPSMYHDLTQCPVPTLSWCRAP